MSQLLPGSLCTQILADLGADVIKIENPDGGDGFRSRPPLLNTTSSFFHIINRNKRSMTLDVKRSEGRDVLLRMVSGADVFLESCIPGLMRHIGLGYENLSELNPRLVYCSLTGFGQDGPYKEKIAHDIDFLSIAGMLDLLGEKNGRPVVPPVQIGGAGGGIWAALGIMAALLGRGQQGVGQYLDVSILDGLTPFLSLVMSQYMADGNVPVRGENLLGGGYAFYNVYETKDGAYLSLGCLEEKFWQEFCGAIGRDDLIEDYHADEPRRSELVAEVRSIFLEKTRDEWMDLLGRYKVCFSPVNTLEEALHDPQIRHRGLWFYGNHPTDGRVPQQAFPVRFSLDTPAIQAYAPNLSAHTAEILKNLGYGDTDIAGLRKKGII